MNQRQGSINIYTQLSCKIQNVGYSPRLVWATPFFGVQFSALDSFVVACFLQFHAHIYIRYNFNASVGIRFVALDV